jgi:chorismate binding enzyme
MHQFVETIRIEGGKAMNLPLHEARMNATRAHFAPHVAPISLQKWLDSAPLSDERIKARVVYDVDGVCETTFQTYKRREIQWLRMVEDNNISYTFKSTDRHELDRLLALRDGCDEVLIVKNGLITDTSFTNVAFFDGHKWLTPAQPLLNGTMRQWLLQRGELTEAQITPASLASFQRIMLFNAMIGAHELELPTTHII